MKTIVKLISAGLLLISGCTNCTTASADTFKVDFDLKGVSDTVKVLLHPLTHQRNAESLAKGQFSNGKVTLTGNIDEPTPVYVYFSNSSRSLPLFVENGTVTVTGDISGTPSERDNTKVDYNFDNINVSGSENYPKFLEIVQLRKKLSEELFALRREHSPLLNEMEKAYRAGDQKRQEELRASDAYKAYEQAENDHAKNIDREYNAYITGHRDSFWGPVAMIYLYVYYTPEFRPLYEQFTDEAKATRFGREIKKELYPVGRPGDQLDNFSVPTADGNSVAMMDVAKNSKLTLIDFWASWCRPCRAEIPTLKKAYELYHDKGFDIMSVSIDDEDDKWRKALAKEQMPWTNCRDTEKEVRQLYGVQSIPMMVAVDKDGKMVFENIRGEELINKIGEILSAGN